MQHRHFRFAAALAAIALTTGGMSVQAASMSFQDPASAAWGGWTRGEAGTSYVHWEEFDACTISGPFCSATVDTTPDAGNLGTTAASITPLTPSTIIAGGGAGGNLYSFSDPQQFDISLAPAAPSDGPVRVALQIALFGTDLDDSSITLGGANFDEKVILAEGEAGGPFGGLDNEYLYLWYGATGGSELTLSVATIESSLSLDALAVDVAAVPLPAAVWMLLSGIGVLVLRGRRRTH